MKPFRRILVPTDFEDAARHAADVAVEIARESNGSLVLVHVWMVPIVYTEGFQWPLDGLEQAAQQALDRELARIREKLASATAALECGPPWEKILEVAQKSEADLIVMGTHGRHGIGRLWLGSVAERVVRTSSIPVLTMRA
jgi:nucleotide-binding universal stress UspA family protein